MPVALKERIFLVGCPRSGTTLLQSLLAAHPQIASFPESHCLTAILGDRPPWRCKLGLASSGARQRLEEFLGEIGHHQMQRYIPSMSFSRSYVQAFIKILDRLTQQQGKSLWLEKTPGHIYYIGYIEKRIEGAKFIHLVRNGADVVASLYDVTHKHPDEWDGSWSLDQCISQWLKDVQISLRYLHKPDHTLVSYEKLVQTPHSALEELCQFMAIDFSETMLEEYKLAAKQVVMQNEPWKASVGDVIRNANGKKFYELFNEEQRAYILQKLSKVSLEELNGNSSGA